MSEINITSDIEKLKDYSRIKLLLAEQLRIIRHYLKSNGIEKPEKKFLLSHAFRFFDEVSEEMRSYSLKIEALRRSLKNSNEEDAYRRAVIHIAGDRGVFAPWPEDRYI